MSIILYLIGITFLLLLAAFRSDPFVVLAAFFFGMAVGYEWDIFTERIRDWRK